MPEDGQILRLITFEEARYREGYRGRTSQYRVRRTDPDYPKPVYRGGRGYLVEHEHQAYLAQLIERARAHPRRQQPGGRSPP
jgi:hypothetical protein